MPKPIDQKYQRGRKPQTEAMRAAAGRPPHKLKDKPSGLRMQNSLPDPPDYLDDLARAEWIRVGRYLLALKRVSEADLQSLAVYATSYTMFGDSIRPLLIDRVELWGLVNDRPKPAKLESIAMRQAEIVLEVAQKFGMTARTRHLNHADRGRPLIPDELHELRGNPSKKKLGRASLSQVLTWSEEDTQPPHWLDKRALAEWTRLRSQYENLAIWTPLDVAVLAIGCACYSLLAKCVELMKSQPKTLQLLEGEGCVEHPLIGIYIRSWRICTQVWKEYGMTPVDRVRFHSSIIDDPEKPKLSVYGA